MTATNFNGLGVALVTPFKADLSVDHDRLATLVNHIIDGGADYLVVLGTTGEAVTLTPDERRAVSATAIEAAAGRVPLVLGAGGNCTSDVVAELKKPGFAKGFSAILSVVPFYNKPSQEGIYRHYKAIAEASPLPVILYNIPSRCGVNMTASTTVRIARDCPNVTAVKEASGNLHQVMEIIREKPGRFSVISGDDAMTVPMMSLGASGVISVAANAFPRSCSAMVKAFANGDTVSANTINRNLSRIFDLLFAEGNPAGIKCALAALGLIEEHLRLPLIPVSATLRKAIAAEAACHSLK